MSTPTRNSQELKDKAAQSIRRMKSFKRSLLTLGGLSKLQRRSITALIQSYWLENAKTNLDTSPTHTINEVIGTHNDATTSQLTSTDTDSATDSEQRSHITTTTTASSQMQQAATRYFDIYESSDTDHSNEQMVFNNFSPSPTNLGATEHTIITTNRFTDLEGLETDSDTDDDMSDTEDVMLEKDEKIRQLEQQIIDIEAAADRETTQLRRENNHLIFDKSSLSQETRDITEQNNVLKRQVEALLKEQNQRDNTDIIDHAIKKNFGPVFNQLVMTTAKKNLAEQALKNNNNLFSRFLKDGNDDPNVVSREVFDKTCLSLLKDRETLDKLKDIYQERTLVPVTEIESMKNDYELHMEMVLSKLLKAYYKNMNAKPQ